MNKIFLDGYFEKNFGDDLFFYIICNRYENVTFYSYSNINYNNIDISNLYVKYGLFRRIIDKLLRIFTKNKFNLVYFYKKKYDMTVKVGGSIFYESCNIETIKRNIKRDYSNKKYSIIGCNVPKNREDLYYSTIGEIIKNSQFTCFRDMFSYKMYSKYSNTGYAPDIVLSLNYNRINCNNDYVVISVINPLFKGFSKDVYNKYKKLINRLIEKYVQDSFERIILMSFCKYEGDEDFISEIIRENKFVNVEVYNYDGNIKETLDIISNCKIVVASRFHANILGLLFDKTVLPIAYSDKTINILSDFGVNKNIIDLRKKDFDNISSLEDKYIKCDLSKEIKESLKQFKELDKEILRRWKYEQEWGID